MPIDYADYPPDWRAISDRIRFDRAGGLCECNGECGAHPGMRCAAEHGQPHPVTGSRVVLTVAHLDHDTAHNADGNLKAMCQSCHLCYDAVHHARNARVTRARKAGQLMLPWVRGE